ncbi:MAG: glycosyltransferase [Kiritimatiellae bacterium]|nr:glycosyltransferase [Kiritimatiellia bacterium]
MNADETTRVLVLSYWNLNSPAFGGGTRIMALLRSLGPRAVLCQPAPRHPDVESRTYAIDLGRRKRAGINWGMFNGFLPFNRRTIRRAIREIRPAVIVHTSMWTHAVTRGMRGLPPMMLDAHDVNAVAIAERYGPWHGATRLVRRWESRTVRDMTHVFACSSRDREDFIRMYGVSASSVSVVPNGVEIETGAVAVPALPARAEQAVGGRHPLLFMGKLDYQPNREALDFLSRRLMPELEAAAPGVFCLLVVGGPVPEGEFHPAIIFSGRVPSVAPWLARAEICLAPIFSGSGTRLKILEYMAARKPVIATPKGAEGIEATPGRDLLLAEQDRFAEGVLRLHGDPDLARRVADAGRALVALRYSWDASRELWMRVIGPGRNASAAGQR